MSRTFSNAPAMRNEQGEQTIKRYVHTPLTIEHNGTNASIHSNGRVTLSKVVRVDREKNEVEVDEIDIPASLIFKLGQLLRATRKIEYVAISELSQQQIAEAKQAAAESQE